MVKIKDLLLSQLETLAKSTEDLRLFAEKHAPDGWDRGEMETVDAMVNVIIKQGWTILATIGEPLKKLRTSVEAQNLASPQKVDNGEGINTNA